MQKKKFETVRLQVVVFEEKDVVRTSSKTEIDVSSQDWGDFDSPFGSN
ncbi:MAG: hypothetical protein IJ317_04395 [Clostridia bacterium]|nr:hypothetical protein [Clostridia bacterium]